MVVLAIPDPALRPRHPSGAFYSFRGIFIVAQRISSVLNADQIIVLDHGRITVQGTHRQLLKRSPIYQEIYHSQLGVDEGNGR